MKARDTKKSGCHSLNLSNLKNLLRHLDLRLGDETLDVQDMFALLELIFMLFLTSALTIHSRIVYLNY